jgi:hypothetical protein
MHEMFHETLFSKWVFKGHDQGLRFDFHLPLCDRDQSNLENVIAAFVATEADKLDTEALPQPTLKDESSKWKCMSYMQKAIRRGQFIHAWRATVALLKGGKTADMMWRRLVVTSLEDIGLADPYAVAFTCWAAGNRKVRSKIGEEQVLAFVLNALCDAPKSRDLCDAVVYNFLPQTFEREFAEVNGWDDKRLVEVASDLESPFKPRYLAHWRMFGPKFGCTTSGNAKSDPRLSFQFYEKINLPPLIQYIAHEGYRRCGEALGIPIPFLWQWMTCSQTAWTEADPFEDNRDSIVDNMLAATFDKHTWQGKGAMKRFLSTCKPVKAWLNQNCTGDQFTALERAVFYAEGALLRPRLFFDGARQFYDHVLSAKLVSNGIPQLESGYEFYKLVQANLDHLDALRSSKG